jgi:hypothetical protein
MLDAGLFSPLDMRLDRLLLLVDPAVWLCLLDHRAEILLPRRVVRDLGSLPQRLLENPGFLLIRQLRGVHERAPGLIEPRRSALDDKLEGAEVVAVFQRDASIGGQLDEHRLRSWARRASRRSRSAPRTC